MAHSGRERHRDREPRRRWSDEEAVSPEQRVFKMTAGERQRIAESLRFIDGARLAIEQQHNVENREIVRELRASADEIFDVLNDLERIE